MAGVTLEIDPTSENAANTPLVVNNNTSTFLLAEDYPPPAIDALYASPTDADGDVLAHHRFRDREGCTVKFAVQAASASALETAVGQFAQKIGKITREGGTLKRTTPAGNSYVLDLVETTLSVPFDARYTKVNRAEITWTFRARPFWRGTAVQQSDTVETTLPYITKTATGPAGDVAARGQLLIDEDQASANQSWFVWGIEDSSLYDLTASSGALFYEAEGRTLLSGSTVVTLSGSSGGGTNNAVVTVGLPTSFVPVLSTQATGGGAHLTHIGQFRVFARVQNTAAGTGSISVALDWAYGDFLTFSRNSTVTLTSDMVGTFRFVDLGLVRIPVPLSGSQRWQGRILALSSAGGDTVNIDYLLFVPVDAGSGEAAAAAPSSSSMELSIYDGFNQTAGALTGKTTSIGSAVWTSVGGDIDDWTIDTTDHEATRTTTGDTARRIISAGTTTFTTLTACLDIRQSAFADNSTRTGIALRIVDASNFYTLELGFTSGFIGLTPRRCTAGSFVFGPDTAYSIAFNTWYTIKVSVDTAGRFLAWVFPRGGSEGSPLIDFTHSQLATGGSHASGKIGIVDYNAFTGASTRDIDNFIVYTPSSGSGTDAVMFANQSAEVRYNGVIRKDSAGTAWANVADYEGDLLWVPAAGREGRSVRWIVKACRNDPATGPDSAIDDISARLTQIPLYLTVPSP